MAPAIGRGDLILVAPAPAKVEPGMILVLRVGGQVVTHRVVAVNPDGTFVTRGDANSVNDAWGGKPVSVEGQYLATMPVARERPAGRQHVGGFLRRRGDAVHERSRWDPSRLRCPSPRPSGSSRRRSTSQGKGNGGSPAFVDSLTGAARAVRDRPRLACSLCYKGACIPSDGPATLDGTGPRGREVHRSALAGSSGPTG